MSGPLGMSFNIIKGTDIALGHTRKNALSPVAGHRFHPQNYPPKIDAKLVKKDNSNSIKIRCTMLDGAFLRNGKFDNKQAGLADGIINKPG
jgi:hypothetical protein